MGEVGDVQEAVGFAAALAEVAGGLEQGQPEFAPAGVVELPVFGAEGHQRASGGAGETPASRNSLTVSQSFCRA